MYSKELYIALTHIVQSAAGNWFADIIRHAYDDCETLKGCGGSDAVLICAGTLRGDSEYGPGERNSRYARTEE